MTEHTNCQQPDRDAPKIKCGYPLPCPYHTVIIETAKTPSIVWPMLPTKADAKVLRKLEALAEALKC